MRSRRFVIVVASAIVGSLWSAADSKPQHRDSLEGLGLDIRATEAFNNEVKATLTAAAPRIVESCKRAPIVERPTLARPMMIWNIRGEVYRHDTVSRDDVDHVWMPRDKAKRIGVVVIVRETEGEKSGFYLSGADAYALTTTACVIRWPEMEAVASASMTTKPPSKMGQYDTMYDVHKRRLADWFPSVAC